MGRVTEMKPRPPAHQRPALPDITGLDEPAWLVHRSLSVLEEIYCSAAKLEEDEESWLKIDFVAEPSAEQVRNELLELVRAPDRSCFMNQAVAFWRLLEWDRQNLILFCRNRSPVANLLSLMIRGSRFNEDFLNGYFLESDFPMLMVSCGALANAPLRVCDARDPDVFLRVLFDAYPHFDCAVCDWNLTADEIRAVARMTKDSPLAFLCPQ